MKGISYGQYLGAFQEALRAFPLNEIVELMEAINFRWAGEVVTKNMVLDRLYTQRAHVWELVQKNGIEGVSAMCSGGFRVAWKYWEHINAGKVAISFKWEDFSAVVEPYEYDN